MSILDILIFGLNNLRSILSFFFPKWNVKITPNKIVFEASSWKQRMFFTVENKSSKSLFDVQIILFFDEQEVESKNFEIKHCFDNSKIDSVEFSDVRWDYSYFGLDAVDTKTNKKCIFIQIHEIPPMSQAPFSIKSNDPATIKIECVNFSKVRGKVLERDKEVATSFNLNRELKVSGIRFKIAKN